MSAHLRLRSIELALAGIGAHPVFTDEQIDGLDDDQAERAARAETDRLNQLIQLDSETTSLTSRRRSTDPQQKLF